jgi:hypothetical protein
MLKIETLISDSADESAPNKDGMLTHASDRSPQMPPPLIVSVPHRLRRTRRPPPETGLETARTKLGQVFTVEEET